jgi:hypothetical protein
MDYKDMHFIADKNFIYLFIYWHRSGYAAAGAVQPEDETADQGDLMSFFYKIAQNVAQLIFCSS